MERVPFDPPLDPEVRCTNCHQWIVVLAQTFNDDGTVSVDWAHEDGLGSACPPVPTLAEPPDFYHSMTAVKRAIARREKSALSAT